MAGYSKNPLYKKLGIKDGYNCLIYNTPDDYFDLLGSIPSESEFTDELGSSSSYDFIHVFVTSATRLESNLKYWKSALKKDGSLWISWPKGGSEISTDLNGNVVRNFGLQNGLVDVKVCAVDEDWSGLKFMYRKKDR